MVAIVAPAPGNSTDSTKARDAGLRPKVHADELSDAAGAALAANVRAVSADHLNHVSPEGVEAMSREGVIAVLLPATSLASHLPFADGRRLIAAGVPVAIGTDFNPNTWCESMQLVIALACHHNGLLPAEAITAATICATSASPMLGTSSPSNLPTKACAPATDSCSSR